MLKEFLRDKSLAQLIMLGTSIVLLLSQFFEYYDETGSLIVGRNGGTIQTTMRDFQPGSGWELHPHAYVILVVLGFAFLRDDVANHPLFKRFGYWAALVLVIWATFPGAYFRSPGAGIGAVCIVAALVAAIIAWLQNRKAVSK